MPPQWREDVSTCLSGFSQILIGHPLDTYKTWLQNGSRIPKIKFSTMYRGIRYPLLSNCVLNLVNPELRGDLLKNIKRVLKDGGRIAISDIVSNKKVPIRLQNDHELWSGCISGAWYEPELISDFKSLGFKNLKFAERSKEPWKIIEDIEFRTVTITGNL